MASSGEVVTWLELTEGSRRAAQLLFQCGLRPGDHLALFMENHPRFIEIIWAAMRSGLFLTAINRHLGVKETAYIVNDCDARVVITTAALSEVAAALPPQLPAVEDFFMVDGATAGYRSYEHAMQAQPTENLDVEPLGEYMLYSSGSTGQPKGVIRSLSGRQVFQGHPIAIDFWGVPARVNEDSVLLITSPPYHSAPFSFSLWTQQLGGTVVIQEQFDPLECLGMIERYRVTHVVLVPTMFVRLLKLGAEQRSRFDLSSLQVAVHGAAPCAVEIKQRVIDWWGPIIEEYYGGTEDNGLTYIRSDEWLSHRGSVGRAAFGSIHIMDDLGQALAPGEIGTVYFRGCPSRITKIPTRPRRRICAMEKPLWEIWAIWMKTVIFIW